MKFEKFNDVLAIIYMVFILVWVAMVIWIIKATDIGTVETLGLGTATGILLAILKDIFQFYFRTNKPTDTPPTDGTGTTTPAGGTP